MLFLYKANKYFKNVFKVFIISLKISLKHQSHKVFISLFEPS